MTDPDNPSLGRPAGPAGAVKATRLSELPRDIAPPRDGWPALEARLREIGAAEPGDRARGRDEARERADARARAHASGRVSFWRRSAGLAGRHRRSAATAAAIAAVLAAVVAGISIDRLLLRGAVPIPHGSVRPAGAGLAAAYVTDPRYLREREALLRSLDARLASLPPPTRKKVLASLATIHQSMREIQQALGREPGNALLQELLVDSYQDEMRVLTAVQEAGAGSGET